MNDRVSWQPKPESTETEIKQLLRSRAYAPVRCIGSGAFGQVWFCVKMRDENIALPCAVKVCRALRGTKDADMLRKLFRNEARNLTRLDHENVIRVHDVFTEGDFLCLELRFIDGLLLKSSLAFRRRLKRAPLDVSYVINIILQAAKGLHHAHMCRDTKGNALGLLHQDIKPSNLIVDVTGRVIVLDFGVSTLMSRGGSPWLGGGTPAYMPPEQAAGHPVGPASDLYALGVVFWELLTLELPPADDFLDFESLANRRFARIDSLQGRSASHAIPVLKRLLAPQANERFSSAGILAQELERLIFNMASHVNLEAMVEEELESIRLLAPDLHSPTRQELMAELPDAFSTRSVWVPGDSDPFGVSPLPPVEPKMGEIAGDAAYRSMPRSPAEITRTAGTVKSLGGRTASAVPGDMKVEGDPTLLDAECMNTVISRPTLNVPIPVFVRHEPQQGQQLGSVAGNFSAAFGHKSRGWSPAVLIAGAIAVGIFALTATLWLLPQRLAPYAPVSREHALLPLSVTAPVMPTPVMTPIELIVDEAPPNPVVNGGLGKLKPAPGQPGTRGVKSPSTSQPHLPFRPRISPMECSTELASAGDKLATLKITMRPIPTLSLTCGGKPLIFDADTARLQFQLVPGSYQAEATYGAKSRTYSLSLRPGMTCKIKSLIEDVECD